MLDKLCVCEISIPIFINKITGLKNFVKPLGSLNFLGKTQNNTKDKQKHEQFFLLQQFSK